jgi:hypothetical protein
MSWDLTMKSLAGSYGLALGNPQSATSLLSVLIAPNLPPNTAEESRERWHPDPPMHNELPPPFSESQSLSHSSQRRMTERIRGGRFRCFAPWNVRFRRVSEGVIGTPYREWLFGSILLTWC